MTSTDLRQKTGRAAWLLLLLLLMTALAAPAAGQATGRLDRQYHKARLFYQNLNSTDRGKSRESWLHCARSFRKLYQAAPAQPLAAKALFMLGTVYRAMHQRFANPLDLGEAIAYYQDVATLFPGHRLADDALMALARIYRADKGEPERAAKVLARIVALYGHGDMAASAARQLRQLKGQEERRPPAPAASPGRQPVAVSVPGRAEPAILRPIRHWSSPSYTRVVIETSAPVRFRSQMLDPTGKRPRRLYLDLDNCRLGPDAGQAVPIGDGLLRQVRSAQFRPQTVRVVLDTQSNISDYKVFNLDDPFRVVIDVRGGERPARTRGKATPSLAQQLGLGIRRIVIDPGHGGKDPGTVSSNGLMEKDITLKVAKKLARSLRARLGCQVILTRNRDVFIPLEERTAIANSREGDLFISIHVNAAPTKAAKGIETYVLDLASNQDAMRVAAQENASSSRNLSDLQAILQDLMRNSKVNESIKLAGLVQESMVKGVGHRYGDVHDLGVKKAPFVVLVGAQMPAILTEIAFLSNPQEEKRLRSDRYLSLVADQIAGGVSRYATSLNLAASRF